MFVPDIGSKPSDSITRLRCNPSQVLMAGGSWDSTLTIWNTSKAFERIESLVIINLRSPVLELVWIDNSHIAAGLMNGDVVIYNVFNPSAPYMSVPNDQKAFPDSSISGMAYLSSGFLVASTYGGTIILVNVNNKTYKKEDLRGTTGKIYSLAPAGNTAIHIGGDGKIYTFDLNTFGVIEVCHESQNPGQETSIGPVTCLLSVGDNRGSYVYATELGFFGICRINPSIYVETQITEPRMDIGSHGTMYLQRPNDICMPFPNELFFLVATSGGVYFIDFLRNRRGFRKTETPVTSLDSLVERKLLMISLGYDWSLGTPKISQSSNVDIRGILFDTFETGSDGGGPTYPNTPVYATRM